MHTPSPPRSRSRSSSDASLSDSESESELLARLEKLVQASLLGGAGSDGPKTEREGERKGDMKNRSKKSKVEATAVCEDESVGKVQEQPDSISSFFFSFRLPQYSS